MFCNSSYVSSRFVFWDYVFSIDLSAVLTSSNDSDNDSLWLTQNMYPLGSVSGFTDCVFGHWSVGRFHVHNLYFYFFIYLNIRLNVD